MPTVQSSKAVTVFVSYSAPKDEQLKNELLKHLTPLKRRGIIESWDITQIRAGDRRDDERLKHLNQADVVLCLLSADFIQSDYCYSIEMTRALERHKLKQVEVIPVVLRSVVWEETPLAGLQALPRNQKPIAEQGVKKQKVLARVAEEIARVAEELLQEKRGH